MKVAIIGAIFGVTFLCISLGIHFGSKWIDKMLKYEPLDPSKPIVRDNRTGEN